MIEGIPRISVLIICYKQEELIKRAINSLLVQKDYIYEICVSDDCSPDKTWEVLQEYDKQYSGLFKLHRNEPNLGIFENIEQAWTMPIGDVIYSLSGDDECGEGWFKTVVEYIQKNSIDYKNELFCIYGDYMGVDPNGQRNIHRNDLVVTSKNMMSLSLRCIVGNRGCCYSSNILKKFFNVSQGRSHIAESAQDRQLQLFAEHYYYIPMVGNIYYSGIGVSTGIMNYETYLERKRINPYLFETFSKQGFTPTRADIRYMKYDDAFVDFLYKKSIKNTVRFIFRWLLSYDPSIGLRSLNCEFLFSHLVKKILHR